VRGFPPLLSLIFIAYHCRPRRQYAAESLGNGSSAPPAERHPPRGLPSDPRPANKTPAALRPGSSSAVDARSSSPSAGHTRGANSLQYTMPTPDVPSQSAGAYGQPWAASSAGRVYSNGAQPPGSNPQRQTSYRPPGASAPRIPGYAGLESRDETSSASPSLDHQSPLNNPPTSTSHFPPDATQFNLSNIPPPPRLNPHSHAPAPSRPQTLERDSSEDILAPGALGFARPLSHSECSHSPSLDICRVQWTAVARFQVPAASIRYDQPAPFRLLQVHT
jgi:hypothetical protein